MKSDHNSDFGRAETGAREEGTLSSERHDRLFMMLK